MIRIHENYPLAGHNTFRMAIPAFRFVETDSAEDLADWLSNHPEVRENLLILGSGSNILFTEPYKGTVIHPVNQGISVVYKEQYSIGIRAEAGTIWDDLVAWTVGQGYAGLENLSWIPGTVGAAPVQNIGAYGAEVANVLDSVEYIDLDTGEKQILESSECQFSYRNSIFKKPEAARWMIWAVTFRLDREPIVDISYDTLKKYFRDKSRPTLPEVREAVISIRKSRLPDPEVVGNAGSFFKNPVVSPCQASLMKQDFPDMPLYAHDVASVKLSAAWLIDQCGWKGYRDGDVGVHTEQALVLVNHGKATPSQILELADRIRQSVKEKFHIKLEPEVRIV